MQARRRASEVGGWLRESLCNSCFSSPPFYICDVAPSLTLPSRLSHSVQCIAQSLFLSLPFFSLPHTHLVSRSVSLSLNKLSFPVFY